MASNPTARTTDTATLVALTLLTAIPACNGAPRTGPPEAGGGYDFGDAEAPFEPTLTAEQYSGLAERTDIFSRIGDIVVVCSELPDWEGHDEFAGDTCSVHRIAGDGSLIPLGISNVRTAQRLGQNRLLLATWQYELIVLHEDGRRATIAHDVIDPRVDSTGHRVVLFGLPVGVASLHHEQGRRLFRFDVDTGSVETLVDGDAAVLPVPIPHSEEVLYVSSASGPSAIWRAGPHTPPQQLTNLGFDSDDPDPLPVYSSERYVWVDEHILVFVAEYEHDSIWAFDIETGLLTDLGPGALPVLTPDGSVIAGGGVGNEGDHAATHVVLAANEGGA